MPFQVLPHRLLIQSSVVIIEILILLVARVVLLTSQLLLLPLQYVVLELNDLLLTDYSSQLIVLIRLHAHGVQYEVVAHVHFVIFHDIQTLTSVDSLQTSSLLSVHQQVVPFAILFQIASRSVPILLEGLLTVLTHPLIAEFDVGNLQFHFFDEVKMNLDASQPLRSSPLQH